MQLVNGRQHRELVSAKTVLQVNFPQIQELFLLLVVLTVRPANILKRHHQELVLPTFVKTVRKVNTTLHSQANRVPIVKTEDIQILKVHRHATFVRPANIVNLDG